MKLLLSFDYELYFGAPTGSVEKCLIEPTDALLAIAQKHQVYFNFFIDTSFIQQLYYYKNRYPGLRHSSRSIEEQLKKMTDAGHDIQLHVHPHWLESFYDGNSWHSNTNRYRLDQWEPASIDDMITTQVDFLRSFSSSKVNAYRAGGWCLPEWKLLAPTFKKNGISIDSTVFTGGRLQEEPISFDFTSAPKENQWKFTASPLLPDDNGTFLEIPITSIRLSPLFYWKLFASGKWNKALHQTIGDGKPMTQTSTKKKLLTTTTIQALSTDGYYAGLLDKIYKQADKNPSQRITTIGHPKACTKYSLATLNTFIESVRSDVLFDRYSDILH
ncbi:MAG: polysaccharide deacetylase family protein [Cytophagaceae bacterium]|nr:polysaccharide deacetylase family protein [Cytophagaceae bacterium]